MHMRGKTVCEFTVIIKWDDNVTVTHYFLSNDWQATEFSKSVTTNAGTLPVDLLLQKVSMSASISIESIARDSSAVGWPIARGNWLVVIITKRLIASCESEVFSKKKS